MIVLGTSAKHNYHSGLSENNEYGKFVDAIMKGL